MAFSLFVVSDHAGELRMRQQGQESRPQHWQWDPRTEPHHFWHSDMEMLCLLIQVAKRETSCFLVTSACGLFKMGKYCLKSVSSPLFLQSNAMKVWHYFE